MRSYFLSTYAGALHKVTQGLVMARRKRPEFHQGDERQLHFLGADFESDIVRRDYKVYRDVYDRAGQKGQLPEAALLAIVVASEKGKGLKKALRQSPVVEPSPPVDFDDGEHTDSNVLGHSEGSGDPPGVATKSN